MIQQSHFGVFNSPKIENRISKRDLHVHMHWQEMESTSIAICRCMDFLMWSIHTMEYYSAFKKEILSYTTT